VTDVRLRAVVESRGLDIELDAAASEVLAVLGPNGAGKSRALHVIAGLVRPDNGAVHVGARVPTDTTTGVHVANHDRRVGLLMQDPLLFPHLGLTANVAFAPRSSRAAAAHWLAEVDAAGLADRMPRQRKVLRSVLARDGRSAVLVTHDLLDVLTLADHVLILESGHISETCSTAPILATPRSRFGAWFAGGILSAAQRSLTASSPPCGRQRGTATPGTTWWPEKRRWLSSPRRPSPFTATSRTASRATPSR
jgi:molybdate transport system ATP-binding protein